MWHFILDQITNILQIQPCSIHNHVVPLPTVSHPMFKNLDTTRHMEYAHTILHNLVSKIGQ